MSSNIQRKGGKKNRKHGRNKKFCERYRAENRREKNKARKQARHLKRMSGSIKVLRSADNRKTRERYPNGQPTRSYNSLDESVRLITGEVGFESLRTTN